MSDEVIIKDGFAGAGLRYRLMGFIGNPWNGIRAILADDDGDFAVVALDTIRVLPQRSSP